MSARRGEAQMSRWVSWLLLAGLTLAIALMVAGAVLALAGDGGAGAHQSSLTRLPTALAGLESEGFFDLGLLVLLATPIARVIALLAGFLRLRAWFFAGVSLAVLVILALSAVLGVQAG